MSASVSRLARLRCAPEPSLLELNEDGAVETLLSWGALPESIWKGNEPSPLLTVEPLDATLIPRTLRFGGWSWESMLEADADARARLTICVADWLLGSSWEPANDCWARGERGGERGGRFEIGEGGTKGKLSRIESAPVAVVIIEDIDVRLRSLSARACCCSRAPAVPLPPV